MDTRYFQYNSGWEGEKLVLPNKPYTTAANLAAFAASDADGNFGVFKPDGTLVTGALATNDQFFFAVKRDTVVDRTTIFTYNTTPNQLTIRKTVGSAATNQVTTVVVSCGGTQSCSNPTSCCTDPLTNYFMGIIDEQTSDRPQKDTWEYNLQGRYGKTIKQLLDGMKSLFNDTNSQMNRVRGRKVVMSDVTEVVGTAPTPNTYTFTLTGLDNKPFKFTYKGFASIAVTLTTASVEAKGSLKSAKQLEFEGLIREGWTTKYIGWPFISSEWGEPTLFSSSTASPLFTQYMINEPRHEDSNVSGVERHFRRHLTDIAVPSGSALETKLNTILGV